MQKHHDTLNRQVADTTTAAYSEWREHIQKAWLHQGLFSSILEHPFVCGFGIVQRLSYSVLMGCRTPGPQGQKVQVNHTHFIIYTHTHTRVTQHTQPGHSSFNTFYDFPLLAEGFPKSNHLASKRQANTGSKKRGTPVSGTPHLGRAKRSDCRSVVSMP